jgi:diguanylate cyclase (GGDEF)-like protein/PAS domain S-box-containing protein
MVIEQENAIEQAASVSRTCRAVGDASPLPMAAIEGCHHLVRYINPAFCALIGKTERQCIGEAFSGVVSVGAECLAALDRVQRSGRADTCVGVDPSRLDGLAWSYAMWPMIADNNHFFGVIVLLIKTLFFPQDAIAMNQALTLSSVRLRELTEAAETLNAELQAEMVERKVAEEALVNSQKRYLDLYELAPIGYLTLDIDGFILDINMNGALLLGEVRAQILQRRFVQFVSSENIARFHRVFEQVLKQGMRQSFDLALQRGDGSVFYAQLDCVRAVVEEMPEVMRLTVVDITERRRSEMEIEHLAFYDSLTQLPNRRLLLSRLQAALTASARTSQHGAVLYIDLDDFKTLNDSQGHFAGDLLLRQVATRLAASVREVDTVARLGGDEFVVLLRDLSQDDVEAGEQSSKIGEKLLATLKEPYQLANYQYSTSGSAGATLFKGDDENIEDLLKRADLALYSAKAGGRARLHFFSPEMQTAVTNRAELEANLRKAIKEKEFVLFYQPQVNHLGRLTGAEALVRWRHPTRGLVLPFEFLPLMEESGLIDCLGQWVLEAACTQLVIWSAKSTTADLRLAINVSASEFYQSGFVNRILTAIDRFGIDPRKLTLELTESVMFTTVDETFTKMAALKSCGVRFSIDDFGVGYSCLSYLKNMPLDQLKLDRSFVSNVITNPNDAAIAKAILALGQSLHIEVVAEGIETEEQRRFLGRHGCQTYQGYLFGRPVPMEELMRRKKSRSPSSARLRTSKRIGPTKMIQ